MIGKTLVLLLLAFGGLSEALKCYTCDALCDATNQKETECEIDTLDRCMATKNAAGVVKTCAAHQGMEWFDCVQEKLGQSGACIKATAEDVAKYTVECAIPETFSNSTAAGRQARQDTTQTMCLCDTDLCNSDKAIEEAGGSGGGDGGATGQIVGASALIASGAALLMINRLFY